MNASANLASQTHFRNNKSGTRGNWRGSNFRGGRGRGRSKPTCQVCDKIGHTAVQCFYRFDKSYTGSNHYAENNKQENHSAFIASPYHGQDYEWYFDSGASNHVTHQNEKLQEFSESNGKNSLLVGNGNRLRILGSGSTELNKLNLHNVLYVPEITKNLLSISKLTADNNAIVEFDANYCYVKDKMTGNALLKGKVKDGLYQLSSANSQVNKDPCTTTSHTIEPSNNDVNHQEEDLAVNEVQPVLSEISVTADEATSHTNETPATTSSIQDTDPVEDTLEDNRHVQQIHWATSIDDRKSMAGQCVFLGETLISWASRKQRVVSRSSTESKYRALADLAAEVA
ncbi:hypothetical protein KIW84_033494 [Lathyrus oleraceus]|uniref:Retrovirus-related Pol polyprotein from transposon TNT 1-94-like beta-barrel domain-containing protein n=1 Tax=Pisum sativum TaxID=3888 RepID=A0A9D5B3V0_PEA|nr:hypothetical protein KIW84_033494 [Pisum sativum]